VRETRRDEKKRSVGCKMQCNGHTYMLSHASASVLRASSLPHLRIPCCTSALVSLVIRSVVHVNGYGVHPVNASAWDVKHDFTGTRVLWEARTAEDDDVRYRYAWAWDDRSNLWILGESPGEVKGSGREDLG